MRVVALLGLHARQQQIEPFELPGTNIFCGNELDPTDQPDAALIFGGDGTIHRHLGSLARKNIPTLVVPTGSGNDFAQSIGIKDQDTALTAWKHFCTKRDNTRDIDLGTIQTLAEGMPANFGANGDEEEPWGADSLETLHFVPDGPRRDLPHMGPRIMQSQLRHMTEAAREATQVTYFCCIAGTGLDAAVNRRALKQSRWLRSHGGYIVALVQTLAGFRPPRITVSVEKDGTWQSVVNERGFLIAAGNGPQYGDGMRLAHRAGMKDGLLDVCFVRLLGKMRLLRLFRVVYRGEHIGMKEVEYFQAARVRIVCDPVMEVFADGEYIRATPVEIGICCNALRIIVPNDATIV